MFMRYLGGGIGHKATWDIVRLADTIKLLSGRVSVGQSSDKAHYGMYSLYLLLYSRDR